MPHLVSSKGDFRLSRDNRRVSDKDKGLDGQSYGKKDSFPFTLPLLSSCHNVINYKEANPCTSVLFPTGGRKELIVVFVENDTTTIVDSK